MAEKPTGQGSRAAFLSIVAFHEPHEPVASPKEIVNQYDGVAKNHNQAQYFANVTNLDAAVGKLTKALEAMKLDENTLVIFTSDNGPEPLRYGPRSGRSFGVAGPLRGMKLWTTEAGFRVAGIMRWPARIKAGQVSDRPVSALDFLPTFCELAGTQPRKTWSWTGQAFCLPSRTNRSFAKSPWSGSITAPSTNAGSPCATGHGRSWRN